ncbi:uncharacterized protein EI90DRAFT_3013311 [Cantharellus anzutake]|uniref:uncharacterized protein n=1 Tax=Cantharellus anzutake TaxID=1750568 RepID=UPI001906F0CC|nr:uncharacterized protein EI90DRAFT_3013311 [Cantharellus anzutake]KAF8337954.1 hypothetical protein EI90DRAFT_3013311 [Cantharellus anzutake]
MSSRRGYTLRTPYEIQRRQRLQPVNCWERRWVTPNNALPGSTHKVLKWVKTDRMPDFSDEEDERAERPAIVVDEELEDAQRASALPEGEGADNEGDDDQPGTPPPTVDNVEQTPDIPDVQTSTVLEPSTVEEEEEEEGPEQVNDQQETDELGFPIAQASGDTSGKILTAPASDGPDLGAISRAHQLLDDAPTFDPSSDVIQDAIVPDEAMEFAVGQP